MTQSILNKLAFTGKLLLVTAGVAAVAGSVVIIMLNAPESHAQAKAEMLTFEVASIKLADPEARRMGIQMGPGGGLNVTNFGLKQLIAFAYDIRCGKDCNNVISGVPGWSTSDRFDIHAKGPQSEEANADPSRMNAGRLKVLRDQVRQRLQALLAERFHLIVRRETREMPVYALEVAKNGPKLKEGAGEGPHRYAGNVPTWSPRTHQYNRWQSTWRNSLAVPCWIGQA